MTRGLQDTSLNRSKALPNGAASTATDAIDLLNGANRDYRDDVDFELAAPALGATPLPDTKTMVYSIEHSDDGSSWTPLYERVFVQTGAGGAGAAAKTQRFRVPSNVKRHLRAKATGSASGDASASSFTLKMLFG